MEQIEGCRKRYNDWTKKVMARQTWEQGRDKKNIEVTDFPDSFCMAVRRGQGQRK